jgi:hypothetical protein
MSARVVMREAIEYWTLLLAYMDSKSGQSNFDEFQAA